MSTNKGISCLLKDKEVFYNYDHWDNVPMGNFMSGSVAEAKDGTLYFGSINGLCRFNPDQVLENESHLLQLLLRCVYSARCVIRTVMKR